MNNEKRIQELLAQAMDLLRQAGRLADEEGEDIFFLGAAYEPNVGWFTPDGEMQEGSAWNRSDCVIGSRFADGYGMTGWADPRRKHGV